MTLFSQIQDNLQPAAHGNVHHLRDTAFIAIYLEKIYKRCPRIRSWQGQKREESGESTEHDCP